MSQQESQVVARVLNRRRATIAQVIDQPPGEPRDGWPPGVGGGELSHLCPICRRVLCNRLAAGELAAFTRHFGCGTVGRVSPVEARPAARALPPPPRTRSGPSRT